MGSKVDTITLVIPCYNEEESIPLFLDVVQSVEIDCRIEYVFVDDGSTDDTLKVLRSVATEKKSEIRYLSFSRNFGKEAALLAGLWVAKGEYIAVMDADLQDPPALLPAMYQRLKSGEVDYVATRRTTRKGEPLIRSLFAKTFYKLINRISDVQMIDGARDYRLMSRQMVAAILQMKEYNRFSKGLFNFVGFKGDYIAYENIERVAGTTSWNFWGLFKYSIEGIVAFSIKPLILASLLGLMFFLLSLVGIAIIIGRYLLMGDPVQGWASIVVILLFTSGTILFTNGILGQYLAKIYLEVKSRPIYIIKEDSLSDREDMNVR